MYILDFDKITLSDSNTIVNPCLFNYDLDTKFFRISGMYNTLFRVSSLPEFIFSTTFP